MNMIKGSHLSFISNDTDSWYISMDRWMVAYASFKLCIKRWIFATNTCILKSFGARVIACEAFSNARLCSLSKCMVMVVGWVRRVG